MMAVIDIEVTIDTVCPYCYLGKKNLEKAMAEYSSEHPEDEFEVVYKPYYLNPGRRRSGRSSKSSQFLRIIILCLLLALQFKDKTIFPFGQRRVESPGQGFRNKPTDTRHSSDQDASFRD
jgi:DSBA-like thioredoxin domain